MNAVPRTTESVPEYTYCDKVPGQLPVLGHAAQFRFRPFEFLASLPCHGDLVRIRMGPRSVYVATHPGTVRQVVVDSRTYDKGGPVFEKARYYLRDGLATATYETHRRQRRTMNPLFHHDRLPLYVKVAGEVVAEATDRWRDGQVVDVTDAMFAMTAKTTALTLASAAVDDAVITEISRLYADITEGVYTRTVAPFNLLTRLPTRATQRYLGACARMWEIADMVIDAYEEDQVDHGDMLSVLVATADDNGDPLPREELKDQVIILITGAVETLGTALAWTFQLLAEHPELEQRAHDEARAVLGDRPATWDDVAELPFTYRVVTESLRIRPPTWMLTRQTTRPATLAGHQLPADATVMFSPYMIHHRADVYAEPEAFDPDRWLPERSGELPQGAFIPFGGGGRVCIAERLSQAEATVMVATIIARWRLRALPNAQVQPVLRAILRPNELSMRLQRR
ncbi:cytochrome P450 [Streptomyces pathocidini]|uniref:Cytochrome P450 n=1 Tax=Streptomyces pathocidini TaxID=1650571 RepID=A0ABW7UUB9_9ACTN|nr:cytochrome P450 [Streptomyces pathocidini]